MRITSAEITIQVRDKTKTFKAAASDDLLKACLSHKAQVDHICRTGLCGTCQVRIEEGSQNLGPATDQEKLLLDEVPLRAGVRLACQAIVLGGAIKAVQPNLKE